MVKKIVLSNNPLFQGSSLGQRSENTIPYRILKISSIERDSNQPRVEFDQEKLSELAESIKQFGVLSPILVKNGKFPGKYTIIAGERRFRASSLAGLSEIPAILDTQEDSSGEITLAKQLIENIQRAQLTPLERSYAISALKEVNNLSIRQVADYLSVSKSSVQRSMELLDLPDDLLNALRQGASESKILEIAKNTDEGKRKEMLKGIDGLTRDQIKSFNQGPKVKKVSEASYISAEDLRVQDEIQKNLGLKVNLKRAKDASAGKLIISFNSEQDLKELFRKLIN